jgi:hypothetical protein
MLMYTLDDRSATLLSKQGIAALQSGDILQARELLSQALQITPADEHAWLWLSGAVTNDAERRYCLERVLAINPTHVHARRGLEQLAAVHESRPPFSLAPAACVPSYSSSTPEMPSAHIQPAVVAAKSAAPTTAPFNDGSLLSILMQPDDAPAPASTAISSQVGLIGASFLTAPAGTLAAPAQASGPAPMHQALPASVVDPARQAAIDYVIRAYGSHRSRDEIVRGLSIDYGLAWDDARNLVFEIERKHRRKIAARQSPFYIFLGVITILGGAFLAGRAGLSFYYMYDRVNSGVVFIPDPRAIFFLFGQLVTGIAMVLGATIGLGQTIKSLFK